MSITTNLPNLQEVISRLGARKARSGMLTFTCPLHGNDPMPPHGTIKPLASGGYKLSCSKGCPESKLLAFVKPEPKVLMLEEAKRLGLKLELKELPRPLEEHDKRKFTAELNGEAPDASLQAEITRLATLPIAEYGRRRKSESKRLGIPVDILEKAVRDARKAGPGVAGSDGKQGRVVMFADPELLPEEEARQLDGAAILQEVSEVISKHVTLLDHAPDALALIVMFTYLHDAFQVSPILAITSPEKGCGKTSLLTLLNALVRKPLLVANVTPASLFRRIEKDAPTLLVDEADTFIHAGDELRGILNAGWLRSSAFVDRTVGDDFEPRLFSVWCPKALAAIGTLPGTLIDRSIEVRMRRQTVDEQAKLKPLRADRIQRDLEPLRRKTWTWAKGILDDGTLSLRDPALPKGFINRLADNWRPLFAIAETAGGEWPERATEAALAFQSQRVDESWGAMLLEDCTTRLRDTGAGRLSSGELVEYLSTLEERPWPACRKGERPIDARWLARKLSAFGISPKNMREDGKVVKGYHLADFREAFERYCPKPCKDEPKIDPEEAPV